MSLYTPEVAQFVRSRNWPSDLQFDIAENEFPAPHLNIIFYRDNWLTLTFEEQMQTTSVVKEIMAKLWADGIPTYTGKMESRRNG